MYASVHASVHASAHAAVHAIMRASVPAVLYAPVHAVMHAAVHANEHAAVHANEHAAVHAAMHVVMHASLHAAVHVVVHAVVHAISPLLSAKFTPLSLLGAALFGLATWLSPPLLEALGRPVRASLALGHVGARLFCRSGTQVFGCFALVLSHSGPRALQSSAASVISGFGPLPVDHSSTTLLW